jgi:acyl transferase domain-containing protein
MDEAELTERANDIAIIGMAGRFPGAGTIDELWQNLRGGVESISFFTDEEAVAAGLPAELLGAENLVKAGGVLAGIELFDAAFFGIPPVLARIMDPQHRLFLECAWEALESAGYDPLRARGAIGVYAGAALNSYLLQNLAEIRRLSQSVGHFQAFILNDKDFLTTQTAYRLNLRGPSVCVQSACSTSLVAVHLACQSLLNGECDLALAGGAAVSVAQGGYLYAEGGILSPDGHCRAFDARAGGTVAGSGVAIVVLKRLADALADGDGIAAVIKGSAINNDGSSKAGFTAPSVDGQARVISEALAVAGVDPESVTYIEAHGTGTALGDPIEISALTQVFRSAARKRNFCALGSVKTNLGHLDVAAGIAGLIKTVLALRHRELPPSLHFERPNPEIDFGDSPFYVNTRLSAWESNGVPRRAGVSSFGIGGTNAHVVLEEAPEVDVPPEAPRVQLLVLSAKTPSALEAAASNLAEFLRRDPDIGFADVAYTLQVGRAGFTHRQALVCPDAAEAAQALLSGKRVATATSRPSPPAVAFLFPGQGAQHAGMGADLYAAEPVFRAEIDRCAELLRPRLGLDLRTVLYPSGTAGDEAGERLKQTAVAQPALFMVEYALARLWMAWGVRPSAMIGHSLGEYTAACLAGVLSLADALALVALRGELMQGAPGGSMLAVPLPETEIVPLLGAELALAAVNGRDRCVVSGPVEAVKSLASRLGKSGVACRPLETSHAFHSAQMDSILTAFSEMIREVRLAPPVLPYLSNVTGTWITPEQAVDPQYWVRHLRETVRFAAGLEELLSEPDRVLLEVGPGNSLSTLARQQGERDSDLVVASMRHPRDRVSDEESLLRALGRLWLVGVEPDWDAVHGSRRRRLRLPTYPFERQRFWLEPPARAHESYVPAAAAAGPEEAAAAARVSAGGPEPVAEVLAAPSSEPRATRRQEILASLRVLVGRLIGAEVSDVHLHTSFLEVGVDSLLLIQTSQAIRERFGVKISLAQLLEEHTTIDAVAGHINQVLPADPIPAQPMAAAAAPEPPREPAREPSPPLRPVTVEPGEGMSSRQQKHLQGLVARYTERTRESKRLTQLHRSRLAENRASVGFRLAWKELVYPIVGRSSAGARFHDVDGNEYVDLAMGFGVHLFGHSPDFITSALEEQLRRGVQLGPQSDLAGEVAELISELTQMERVVFCNSGTEAVMTALRLARAATGREKIASFVGSYHGSFDGTLARGLSRGGEPVSVPLAPGVLPGMVKDVLLLDYATPASLELLERRAGELAAILVEPVQSRRPDLQPREFLQALRRLTERSGAVLIFDEVITGFRTHPGGAQAWFGVRADLATYGKVIGGGLPVGVVAGKAAYLDAIDGGAWSYGDDSSPPAGKTFFAGTFCKHPLTMAAARAVLCRMKAEGPELQRRLNETTSMLAARLNQVFAQAEAPIRVTRFGSLFRFEFDAEAIWSDLFFYHLAEKGVYVWEGRTCFLSTAHTEPDLLHIVQTVREALAQLQAGGFFTAMSAAPSAGASRAPALPKSVPMTDSQRGIWAVAQTGPQASAAYNECLSLRMSGALDLAALRGALQRIVDRHEALRATFSPDGDLLRVAPELRIEIPLSDLTGIGDRESAARSLTETESRRPFDLALGPLVRARVVRMTATDHLLLLIVHHIVTDGRSFEVLLRELEMVYVAERRGQVCDLPPAASFQEYAWRQSEMLEGPEMAAAERYWLARFDPPPPPLALPTDRPRPVIQTYRGGRETMTLDPELVIGIRALSTRERCTLFMVLLSAFEVLMHHVTGQNDLVIGVHSAQQALVAEQAFFGLGINTLPVRSRIAAGQAFTEILEISKRDLLRSFSHDCYHFSRLMRKLKMVRDPSRPPLIAAVFNLDGGASRLRLDDLDVTVILNPVPLARFDLFWNLAVGESEIGVECIYNADLFDVARVRVWLTLFERVLSLVAAAPEISIGAVVDALVEMTRQGLDLERGRVRRISGLKMKVARRKAVSLEPAVANEI